jgi:hypothetical protein
MYYIPVFLLGSLDFLFESACACLLLSLEGPSPAVLRCCWLRWRDGGTLRRDWGIFDVGQAVR